MSELPRAGGRQGRSAAGRRARAQTSGDATYKSVDRQVAIEQFCALVVGDLQKAVGRNLRAIREERGLSQERFADVLEVHRTYYGGVERGERNLTLKSVERIAERVGVEPTALLGLASK